MFKKRAARLLNPPGLKFSRKGSVDSSRLTSSSTAALNSSSLPQDGIEGLRRGSVPAVMFRRQHEPHDPLPTPTYAVPQPEFAAPEPTLDESNLGNTLCPGSSLSASSVSPDLAHCPESATLAAFSWSQPVIYDPDEENDDLGPLSEVEDTKHPLYESPSIARKIRIVGSVRPRVVTISPPRSISGRSRGSSLRSESETNSGTDLTSDSASETFYLSRSRASSVNSRAGTPVSPPSSHGSVTELSGRIDPRCDRPCHVGADNTKYSKNTDGGLYTPPQTPTSRVHENKLRALCSATINFSEDSADDEFLSVPPESPEDVRKDRKRYGSFYSPRNPAAMTFMDLFRQEIV